MAGVVVLCPVESIKVGRGLPGEPGAGGPLEEPSVDWTLFWRQWEDKVLKNLGAQTIR